MKMPVTLVLCATLLMAGASTAALAAIDDNETPVVVHVQKNGELIIVDADFSVSVAPQQAWEVLTDFDHMSRFISNVTHSAVTARQGNTLQVTQKGATRRGPLSFSFNSVREIELKPVEKITSRLLSGNMKQLDGTTQLSPSEAGTHIVYHAESIPNTYVPPLIGPAFIETESRHQFEEIRREMLTRKAATASK